MSRRRKILIRVLILLLTGLIVLIAALPLWLPWVLRPIAKSFHLTYSAYEREGYSRFRLTDVAVESPGGIFRAKQADALVPTVWLSRVMLGADTEPFLQIHSWEFVSRTRSNDTASATGSVYTNFVKTEETLATLRRWVPTATLTNGAIEIKKFRVAFPQATWINGKLAADAVFPGNRATSVELIYPRPTVPLHVSLNSAPLQFQCEFNAGRTPAGLQIDGVATWLTNRVEFAAAFPPSASRPDTATLRADSFEVPAESLRLERYRNLAGSLHAEWKTNEFTVDLTAKALPREPDNAPPVDLEAHARGDTNFALINAARLRAPGLDVQLSEDTRVEFRPPYLRQPATLTVAADLAQQPWLTATGNLAGTAVLSPNEARYPRVTFNLNGNGVALSNLHTKTLQLEGEFDWPQLKIAPARIETADGSIAQLIATADVREKSIASAELNSTGTFGREFLPKNYSFERASMHADFQGALSNLSHSGSITATNLQLPGARPMNASLEWSGLRRDLTRAALQLSAGNSILTLRGSGTSDGRTNEIAVAELTLRSDTNELRLEKPFRVVFLKPDADRFLSTNAWSVQLDSMHWSGNGRDLSVQAGIDWPERGTFHATAQSLDGSLTKDFVAAPSYDVTLNRLVFDGGWTNGPLTFALESSAAIVLLNTNLNSIGSTPGKDASSTTFITEARINGDDRGILIEQLSIASGTSIVCRAEGQLPLALRPGVTGDLVRISPDASLQLRAFTEPDSALWDELAQRGRLRLEQPHLDAQITGTWAAPEGHVTLTAQRIEFPSAKKAPALDDIDFLLQLNRDTAVLTRLYALVEGQMIRGSGEIPLGGRFWEGFGRGRYLPDWRQATAQLKMESASVAAFAGFAPEILAPQGEIMLDLRLERGGLLHGEARLENARTHPIGTMGPVRDIKATALFDGSTVVLTNFSGNIGSQPILIHGGAQVNENLFSGKSLPPLELHVQGTNVPLVRQPEVVIRADLNVTVTNSAANEGGITGTVRLHDCFLLGDLEDLVPGSVTTAERRPPYFSIPTEPWARWQVALDVQGERFLKVRSPLFRGVASTTLRIEGTLKDPLALGELRINSGIISFPFGSLDVKQGFVTLTSDNPYHPQLFVTASAQQMGYELKMEATGPADQPIIQFNSSPPLSSEQIVLMLTTGQMPRGLTTGSTQQRAQGFALFVGKNFLSELGIGSGEGRLTLQTGRQVTEAGRPTQEVELKINDTWSLQGEYDRFSQYNVGFKWKVYSK